MEAPTDEFVKERMGEPLELKLRQNEKFREKQKYMRDRMQSWQEYFGGPENREMWEQLDQLQEAMSEHNYLYGKEAYKLGYCDGIQVGKEQMPDEKTSIFSVEDMAHLIYIYDAVKRMNRIMLGETLPDIRRDNGVFGALDRIFDIIEHGISSKIRLLGEDEAFEVLTGILDNRMEAPEIRAKQLLRR